MENLLNIQDAKEYLENNYFTDICYKESNGNCLRFTAIDEDDMRVEIEFSLIEENRICVSVNSYILEILRKN